MCCCTLPQKAYDDNTAVYERLDKLENKEMKPDSAESDSSSLSVVRKAKSKTGRLGQADKKDDSH